ncbi:unnamed protein product, partial [Brassica rapa subsp. trilocularis]
LNVSPTCLLCNTANESRDHLFFQCDFSDRLLALVTRRCGFLGDQSWNGCLNNLIAYQGTNCQRKLCPTSSGQKGTIAFIETSIAHMTTSSLSWTPQSGTRSPLIGTQGQA